MVTRSELRRVVAEFEAGGQLIQARELAGGVSATVLRLDISTRTGERRTVVFRQHRDVDFKSHSHRVTTKEHSILVALRRAGLAVPEPYVLDATGALTAPYLMIEFIEGTTEVASTDLPWALDRMAQFLAALHALDPDAQSVPGLDHIEDPTTAIVPYLPRTEAGERILAAISASDPDLSANRSAILHGDFWPGNVMWQHRRLAAVIDWEDASIGDPLADLASARVELLCRYGRASMERFTQRYLALTAHRSTPPMLDALPLWETYVSASALATMGRWGLEPAEEAHRRRLTEGFLDRAVAELIAPSVGVPARDDRGPRGSSH